MANPDSSSLAAVLDRILDKGLVVDIWARVSVVGIEILTVEARVVAASVDTFLHYAENITKIEQASQSGDMEELKDIEIEKPARPDNYQQAPSQ
ncbi:gas vesicle protein GvpA [Haloarcula salina]|uniref:Gas vesicle protein A n=1 Tax=Haloarcula salina TaxID=1429914 RepID=A0AA41G868_9EURY|nr:gas vesicle structural protein GvpA [Haloarcula salina]MBV0901942.1 gas vesicle structural protein GvpA [Haloarcula salina]